LPVDDAARQRARIVQEVRREFERYERALREHDVARLNAFFLDSPDTVRFGLTEQHYGFAAIARWRQSATPVHPQRRLQHTVVSVFGNDVACVSTQFTDPLTPGIGRQTLLAHVSTSKA